MTQGLAGLTSPAMVKEARTIEVTRDMATPVPIVKAFQAWYLQIFPIFSSFIGEFKDCDKF